MPTPEHTPKPKLLNLRRIGDYYVAEVEGKYIVCDDSMTCFMVEAGSPEDAVKAVEDYLKGVSGEE
jgi:predicted transcriptional regulator